MKKLDIFNGTCDQLDKHAPKVIKADAETKTIEITGGYDLFFTSEQLIELSDWIDEYYTHHTDKLHLIMHALEFNGFLPGAFPLPFPEKWTEAMGGKPYPSQIGSILSKIKEFDFEIVGTDGTFPNVSSNTKKGTIEIAGRMVCYAPDLIFYPILSWVEAYGIQLDRKIALRMKLEYFNTSASKGLLDFFRLIEEYVDIYWLHHEYDDDMEQAGHDFKALLSKHCSMQIIQYG